MIRGVGMVTALAVTTALLLASCGGSDPQGVFEVHGTAGSTTLEVAIASCGATPKVSATETADDVRLHVAGSKAGDQDDCLATVTITLDAPLGERKVLDDATGKALTVTAPENTSANP